MIRSTSVSSSRSSCPCAPRLARVAVLAIASSLAATLDELGAQCHVLEFAGGSALVMPSRRVTLDAHDLHGFEQLGVDLEHASESRAEIGAPVDALANTELSGLADRLTPPEPAARSACATSAASVPGNPLPLSNGSDVTLTYSDPSVGAPTGSMPDTSGDLFWKVYPHEAMMNSSGTLEASFLTFSIFDTNWTTSPDYFDVVFSHAIASTTSPGNREPDFSDPNAVLMSFGNSGLPNPCTVSPSLCTSIGGTSTCPPSGTYLGYDVSVQLGTCSSDGLILTTNTGEDFALTFFLPGGMTFTSGPPGACGAGDYVSYGHSSDEQQDDHLGTGYSAFGGFQLGAAPGFVPDNVTDVSAAFLEFCDPITLVAFGIGGPATDVGLVMLNAPVVGSSFSLAYQMFDELGIGELMVAATSALAPLPPPGIPVLGGNLLLNPGDPLVSASTQIAPITNDPSGNGKGVTSGFVSLGVPASVTLKTQAFRLELATIMLRDGTLPCETLR